MVVDTVRQWYGRHSGNSRVSRSDRWLRLFIWLTLANAFHLIVLWLLSKGLAMEQAKDALRRVGEAPHAIWGTALLLPSLLAALTIGASSALLGTAIRPRMMSLTSGSISSRAVETWCVVVCPAIPIVGVAIIATGAAAVSTTSTMQLAAFFTAIGGLSAINAFLVVKQRDDLRRYRLVLALMLPICISLILACSLNESWAIVVGAVPLLFLGVVFWAAVLTQLFIGIPLLLNWLPASVGWIITVVFALTAFNAGNPYRVPAAGTPKLEPEEVDAQKSKNTTEAFFEWLEGRLPKDETSLIPVFLVSANGGGIRTGYYAARTLALLERESEGNFSRNVFAYSGVSGGSLGIAAFVNSVARNSSSPFEVLREIDEYFARDFLSPVVGRLVIGDLLKSGFNLQSFRARDQVFESRLHREWLDITGSDFFEKSVFEALGRRDGQRVAPPWVTFNATIAETGARLELSNFVTGNRRDRGRSYFAVSGDIKIPSLTVAQAVHMSARFPGFSPPASLQAHICEREEPGAECVWLRRHWITIVDGGYNDNSGLAPLVSIVNNLTCLRDRGTRPCRFSNGREYSDEPLSDDTAIADRRKKLLARVRFFTLALDGNPTYQPDDEKRKSVQERASTSATGDPFYVPWRAGRPMRDLSAAFSALDNARAGREFDSWYSLDLLMQRLPALTEDDMSLIDENFLLNINTGIDRRSDADTPEIRAACEGLNSPAERERFTVDIPLGWSLSARAQNAMKCVTERAMNQRFKTMKCEVPGWATEKECPLKSLRRKPTRTPAASAPQIVSPAS
jgi:hypothetical protein